MNDPTGVVFPKAEEVDGRRSTSATGRGIVADALRPVDPVGAAAAQRETTGAVATSPTSGAWWRRA